MNSFNKIDAIIAERAKFNSALKNEFTEVGATDIYAKLSPLDVNHLFIQYHRQHKPRKVFVKFVVSSVELALTHSQASLKNS